MYVAYAQKACPTYIKQKYNILQHSQSNTEQARNSVV